MQRDREAKQWANYVGATVLTEGKLPPAPLERARLTIVRHGHRMLDFDGVVGSCKPVVDALKTCGILKDDSWKVLGAWSVDQKFRPRADGPLLEVFIEELPLHNRS